MKLDTPIRARVEPKRCIVDPHGYYYIMDMWEQNICRIDSQGKAEKLAENASSLTFGSAMDGTPLFAVGDSNAGSAEIFWIGEAGERHSLPRLSGTMAVTNFCVNETGLCYYMDIRKKIHCWDMTTGVRSECYDLEAAGIYAGGAAKMSVDREGALSLYFAGDSERGVLKLDTRGTEKAETLRLYIYNSEFPFFESCAANFSRMNPGVEIVVEASPGWNEDTARMQVDIAAGAGPDMMIIDSETMHNLWEKGVLADMTDMLVPSTREELWSFLLENGTMDGKLAGLGIWYKLNSMLVSDTVWEGDTWTCMDVVELLEREDAPEAFFRRPGESDNPGEILRALVLEDLEHSPFIDWERGKCSFDSDDFVRVLNVVQKYRHIPGTQENMGRIKLLKQGGKALAEIPSLMDMEHYNDILKYIEGSCHLVGYPTESGNGTFPTIYAYFCVNQASPNKDIAAEFLDYSLSRENQRRKQKIEYTGTLRKDVAREVALYYSEDKILYIDLESNRIKRHYDEEKVAALRQNYRNYMELMDNLAPAPVFSVQVQTIISEEAEAFFAGGQSAERTAELIQNRVQLYLDEHAGE